MKVCQTCGHVQFICKSYGTHEYKPIEQLPIVADFVYIKQKPKAEDAR